MLVHFSCSPSLLADEESKPAATTNGHDAAAAAEKEKDKEDDDKPSVTVQEAETKPVEKVEDKPAVSTEEKTQDVEMKDPTPEKSADPPKVEEPSGSGAESKPPAVEPAAVEA